MLAGRPVPFLDDFERADSDSSDCWTFSENVEISGDHEPLGERHLLFDAGSSGIADAVLCVSLPFRMPRTPLELNFFAKPIGSTNSNALVVEISSDQTKWHAVTENPIRGWLDGYTYYPNDLAELLREKNLAAIRDVFVRFRHMANGQSGGKFALDNVEITDHTVRIDATFRDDPLGEGRSTEVVLTRHTGTDSLALTLLNERPDQMLIPEQVTIAANESSARFTLTAVNDGEIDGAQRGCFSVEGRNVNRQQFCLTILDDDTEARRTIGGQLAGVLSKSTYSVVSTLEVSEKTTLEIEPSTVLKFVPQAALEVKGTLVGHAGSGSEIVFTSANEVPGPGAWPGVVFTGTNSARTSLEFVNIEYATTGLTISPGIGGAAFTIANSRIHHSALDGIGVHANSGISIEPGQVVVRQNNIHHNGRHGVAITAFSYGCDTSQNAADVIGNASHDNREHGVWMSAAGDDNTECWLERNGAPLGPVSRPAYLSGTFVRNHVYRNARDGVHSTVSRGARNRGVMNATFTNNLVASNGQHGFEFFESDADSSPALWNNTVAGNVATGITYNDLATIHNNIVHDNGMGIEKRDDVVVGDDVSHNLVVSNKAGDWIDFPLTFGRPKGDPDGSVVRDNHQNILEDPRFIGQGDYHLRYDSPAVGAGLITAATPATDSDGQARDASPDIGYDEYVSYFTPDWAHDGYVDHRGDDTVVALAAGYDGSIYVAGTMNVIGDETTSPGFATTFIQRYAADGTTQWQVDIDGPGDIRPKQIAVDREGDVFVVGNFAESVDFDPSRRYRDNRDALESYGEYDVFMMKLDSTGGFQWVYRVGSESVDRVTSFAISPQGDLVLGGKFSGATDFNPNPHPLSQDIRKSHGKGDAFLLSVTPSGEYFWAWTSGGVGDDSVTAVAVDETGLSHVALSFEENVDINSDGRPDVVSRGGADIAVFQLDGRGRPRGPFLPIGGPGRQTVDAVSVDGEGNRYLAGTFQLQPDFDPDPNSTHFRQSVADSFDAFFMALSPSGALRWVEQVGGPGDDRAVDVDLRTNGDVLLTGQFAETITANASERIPSDVTGNGRDSFLLSLSRDGAYQDLHTYGGPGTDRVLATVVAPDGRVLFGGNFSDALELPTTPAPTVLVSRSRQDAFVAQLAAENDYLPGDFHLDRTVDAEDIDLLFSAIRNDSDAARLDLTRNGELDTFDANQMVVNLLRSAFGDSNLDGVFDSSDLVAVFKAGEFEDRVPCNSGWADGDWNGDCEFDTADLVLAFQWGGYRG